ncbi:MAG: hypothetical protein ACRERS_08200, partial [Methylococcales bacterium]
MVSSAGPSSRQPRDSASPTRCESLPRGAFQEQDADRFFGREELTLKLHNQCRDIHEAAQGQRAKGLRFLAIHGPSGSGKSSLARAGLLPESRLITLSDEHGHARAEITHEALLDHWQTLQDWLSNSRHQLRFADRLNEAVAHWEQHRLAKALLWSEPPDFDLLEVFQQEVSLTARQMGFYSASRKRRRKRKVLKLALAAFLVVATAVSGGAAWWAMRAETQALAEKNRVLTKALALEVINAMIYDLADKVAPLRGSAPIVNNILKKNIAFRDEIFALDPHERSTLREISVRLNRLGNLWLKFGYTQDALDAYRQSLAIREKLTQQDPDNAKAQRDLAVSHSKIGDAQIQLGDKQAALAEYRKTLAIVQELAADTHNRQAQDDLKS